MFDQNDEVRRGMYNKAMKNMFQKMQTIKSKPLSQGKKTPETIDRNWWWGVYGKINKGLPPLRRPKQSKK